MEVNKNFASRQLEDWKSRRSPRLGDRWIRRDDDDEGVVGDTAPSGGGMATGLSEGMETRTLTELEKRLLGLAEWKC